MQKQTLELTGMVDCDRSMDRIRAWFMQEMIDRPPIRFYHHNAQYEQANRLDTSRWPSLKHRWFDAEYQVESFVASIGNKTFHAETFPVFWPNLGPEVYAAFWGCELEFQEVTSYAVPVVRDWTDVKWLTLDTSNQYFRKIEEMTRLALDRCRGQFLVGYTDLHPGVDCAAAWRGPEQLCVDMVTAPEEVEQLIDLTERGFQQVYDRFDSSLRFAGQPSVTWMGIPSFGKLHIPSCDFAALVSPAMFDRFILPVLEREIEPMSHNIFHLDGRGVARHMERILDLPHVQAIQWAQGVGDDRPILQWAPLIQRIQAAGKSVVVDLQQQELEPLIKLLRPEGLFLCISAEPGMESEIVRRIERW